MPDIPTDQLILWLAADRGVTLAEGFVSKWLDQSGNHADAVQVAAMARPRRIASAENGLPMLEFDGVDDSLALPEGFADFSSGLSFFAVVRLLEDGVCSSVLQLSNEPEQQDIDFGRFQGSIHYEVAEVSLTGPAGEFAIDETTLLDYVHDTAGNVESRIDGQFMVEGVLQLPEVSKRLNNFVGRSLYADCQPLHARVGEILLYARPLEMSERLLVEQYLGEKWGCCRI